MQPNLSSGLLLAKVTSREFLSQRLATHNCLFSFYKSPHIPSTSYCPPHFACIREVQPSFSAIPPNPLPKQEVHLIIDKSTFCWIPWCSSWRNILFSMQISSGAHVNCIGCGDQLVHHGSPYV